MILEIILFISRIDSMESTQENPFYDCIEGCNKVALSSMPGSGQHRMMAGKLSIRAVQRS